MKKNAFRQESGIIIGLLSHDEPVFLFSLIPRGYIRSPFCQYIGSQCLLNIIRKTIMDQIYSLGGLYGKYLRICQSVDTGSE